jgi:hypothetical protein
MVGRRAPGGAAGGCAGLQLPVTISTLCGGGEDALARRRLRGRRRRGMRGRWRRSARRLRRWLHRRGQVQGRRGSRLVDRRQVERGRQLPQRVRRDILGAAATYRPGTLLLTLSGSP